MKTPETIDQAKVVLINVLTDEHFHTNFTHHNADNFELLYGLAICQYEGDQGYYLFYCDLNWKVLNDTYHNSVEAAIEQAELEFNGSSNTWNKL